MHHTTLNTDKKKMNKIYQRIKLLDSSSWAPAVALIANLALAYITYFATRLIFLAVNYSYFADNLSTGHLAEMLRGGLVFDTSAIMYTNALYILLMLLPVHLKERKGYHKACKWLFVAVNGIAVVMNMADTVYFQYTSRRTTSTVFSEFSHESNIGSVIAAEMAAHWYLWIAAVAIIALLWLLYADSRLNWRRIMWWRYDAVQALCLAVMAALCVAGMRGGFAHSVRPITVSNANQYVDRPIEAALVLNTPFSILRTIGKNVFADPHYFASEREAQTFYTPMHQPADSTKFNNKNVVVIIIESFGKEYIGSMNPGLEGGHYKGYTPFTDSLAAHSATFRYSFANGRKSIDAMPSVLSSIPMFVEPFFLTPASMNHLTGLAGILDGKGYHTAFFHGAQNGSMGFQAFARSTGFKEYYGRTEFDADPQFRGDKDYDGMWAIWDEPFLQFMLKKLNSFKQPFMSAVFTASSHHPFKVPQEVAAQYPEEGGLPILKCIRYTDHALRRFFDRAKHQPWFRNTIFVIVADHTNQNKHEEYKTDLGLYSIPIIFYTPDGSITPGCRTDVIAQQIDIMPTVLSALGYDKPYVAFGSDLLTTPPTQTWAVNYNNGIYQYAKGGYLLQFDGTRVRAAYDYRNDPLLRHNVAGHMPAGVENSMVQELKSLIQQYMDRMNTDRLVAK